ncbi:restriction modification system DNA specificity subunit [Planktothrix agardhii NIES-204]|jgi:type I restriction enzyme S subunit|nr:restriction modification system DNA specificity subunit [Planktothrix agardhii NIES-204]
MNLPKGWKLLSFSEAFKDRTGGQQKIKKNDYLASGNLPIIDQGQEFVAGFTNNLNFQCNIELPCILFGDHTKKFKFVEKPFALGADGVKVLETNKNIDTKFAFYYLKTLYLPDVGYSRHFRFLKRTVIPVPPIASQRRIADILDKADEIIRKRKEAIALTEQLLKSTFLDMFYRKNLEDCQITTLEKIISKNKNSIRTGPFGSQLLHSEFVDQGIAVLGIDNAVNNYFTWGKQRFITEEKYKQLKRYTVNSRDVIITIMGTCGKCAIIPENIPIAINTKHLCCISLNEEKCLPEFLHSYFLIHPHSKRYLSKYTKGAIMDGLNMTIIKQMPIPLFSINLQKKYKNIFDQTNSTLEKYKTNLQESENLFNSLLQKAFKGEL